MLLLNGGKFGYNFKNIILNFVAWNCQIFKAYCNIIFQWSNNEVILTLSYNRKSEIL